MTRTEELANADGRLAPAGQISDEDLETVAGGLPRPLGPDSYALRGTHSRPDTGQDHTGDA